MCLRSIEFPSWPHNGDTSVCVRVRVSTANVQNMAVHHSPPEAFIQIVYLMCCTCKWRVKHLNLHWASERVTVCVTDESGFGSCSSLTYQAGVTFSSFLCSCHLVWGPLIWRQASSSGGIQINHDCPHVSEECFIIIYIFNQLPRKGRNRWMHHGNVCAYRAGVVERSISALTLWGEREVSSWIINSSTLQPLKEQAYGAISGP